MLIKNYGLFWRADEVEWEPGKGCKFRLLGRQGEKLPSVSVVDFRHQQGIYILYDDYGPHYVGLTRRQGLGKRLKDRLYDDHGGLWDRFSWFGFRTVLKKTDRDGLRVLRDLSKVAQGKTGQNIGDIEAILILAMGVSNKKTMSFAYEKKHDCWCEWEQVKWDDVDPYLEKVS